MCTKTPDDDWVPFYFCNMNRFPGIQQGEPMFAIMEYCPECSDNRLRVVDPTSFEVVGLGESTETQKQQSSEPTLDRERPEGATGLDLESPGQVPSQD